MIRLTSASSDGQTMYYTLIVEPYTDEFELISGYYEIVPHRHDGVRWLPLTRYERWPNNLIYKLLLTGNINLDYVVCFYFL